MSTRQSRIMLCGLIAAVLLFSSLAFAKADPNKPCHKDPNAPWHKDPNVLCHKDPNATPCAMMKEKLGLSDEQAAQMEQLMTANKEKMKGAHQAIQEKRKGLDAAVESGAGEEAIRAAAADLGKALGDAAVLCAANLAEVKKILTPEQFQKWQQAKQERQEHWGMRGPGKGPEAWGKAEGKACEAAGKAEKPEGAMEPQGPQGPRGRMGPPDPQQIFDRKDENNDGKLTVEEYTTGGRATEERFDRADTNGDGVLTLDEFEDSFKQAMGSRRGPQ